ncbi:CotH protein [Fibrobacter sp. UWP2]|nr:CotH protein [Fibrobacter sp. UWP2]
MPNNGIPYIRITMADTSALALVDADSSPVFSDCMIEVAGNGKYSDLATRAAQIRLRGNSTRLWYDKKPYRIKFNVKTEVLGLPANRDWVLLANFRDPTHLMNAVAFDMARHMGSFNFVNANRFVEVEINGDYKGMYQLTEQIEQATSRVNVDVNTGTLLSLDADDGPELSPNASNNFWSSTYKLPVAVKYPKSPSTGTLELIKADFNKLEQAIAAADYATVQALLDVNSFIDFLILQEVTRNVELEAPRSMYLHKASDQGKYVFGPVWDFDGGFNYSWDEDTKQYFKSTSYTWILGNANPSTSPYNCTAESRNDWGLCSTSSSGGNGGFGGWGSNGGFGGNSWEGSGASGFFTNLFSNAEFLNAFKTRWSALAQGLLESALKSIDTYATECSAAMANDSVRWPWPNEKHNTGKNPSAAIVDLKNWLTQRFNAYSQVIESY